MTLGRGRILRAPEHAVPVSLGPGHGGRAKVVRRDELAARERAEQIVARAESDALALRARAEEDAAEIRRAAEERGRAAGLATFLAATERARTRELHADESTGDRLVVYARLLAERMLRRAVELDATVVAELAHHAIAEARGARRIVLRAHAEDAPVLFAALAQLGSRDLSLDVAVDAALARGDLRLETDVGTFEARIGTSLSRLAAHLAEAIRP